jgi:hypothetical protein
LILALACVARLAEIAADIGTALRALANAQNPQQRGLLQYFNRLPAGQAYAQSMVDSLTVSLYAADMRDTKS